MSVAVAVFSTHNFDASNQQVGTNDIYQRQTCSGSKIDNNNNNDEGNALNKLRFFLQLIKSNHFAIFGAWQKTNKKCAEKLADTKRTKSYLPGSPGWQEDRLRMRQQLRLRRTWRLSLVSSHAINSCCCRCWLEITMATTRQTFAAYQTSHTHSHMRRVRQTNHDK